MFIKEAAETAGISIRTLHYYDEIGLLSPNMTEGGYRVYENGDLARLQHILFFKELGFPLEEIKDLLDSPSFDQLEALKLQKNALIRKRNHLESMIQSIDKTILDVKGEIQMSNKDRFKGFDFSENPYEQEAIDKWGAEAVSKMKSNTDNLPEGNRVKLEGELDELFQKLASLMDQGAKAPETLEAIGEWYRYLNKLGNYSPEAFNGLGKLYVEDIRFKENMDQYRKGFAHFMNEAMSNYVKTL